MTIENLHCKRLSATPETTDWPEAREEYLPVAEKASLFVREARPAAPVRAIVVLVHGMGEHLGRYGHVAAALLARGFAVVGWDLRGHGRSSGVRGDVAHGELLVGDLAAVCAHFRQPGCPLFIFGHSLGGQIALRFLEKEGGACRGAVIASPWLRLAFDPPWWKLLLARVAMSVRPGFIQQTALRPERLSRDLAHLASFPHPELTHRRISARMYFGLREAGERMFADAARLHTPLLLLHGDDDPVTSHRATCDFFERVASADKTLRIFPGARHEMHNDLDRAQVLREVGDWIEARLVPARAG